MRKIHINRVISGANNAMNKLVSSQKINLHAWYFQRKMKKDMQKIVEFTKKVSLKKENLTVINVQIPTYFTEDSVSMKKSLKMFTLKIAENIHLLMESMDVQIVKRDILALLTGIPSLLNNVEKYCLDNSTIIERYF